MSWYKKPKMNSVRYVGMAFVSGLCSTALPGIRLSWNFAKMYLQSGQQLHGADTQEGQSYDSSERTIAAWTHAVPMKAQVQRVLGMYMMDAPWRLGATGGARP
jgi:hypothetical protein